MAIVVATASGARAPGDAWRATDQDDLERALVEAPTLEIEYLGEPARGVLTFTDALVPNMDGNTWDYLQWYFKKYYGPTWLFAMDLGTGEVRKQRCADGRQYYLSRGARLGGKVRSVKSILQVTVAVSLAFACVRAPRSPSE